MTSYFHANHPGTRKQRAQSLPTAFELGFLFTHALVQYDDNTNSFFIISIIWCRMANKCCYMKCSPKQSGMDSAHRADRKYSSMSKMECEYNPVCEIPKYLCDQQTCTQALDCLPVLPLLWYDIVDVFEMQSQFAIYMRINVYYIVTIKSDHGTSGLRSSRFNGAHVWNILR